MASPECGDGTNFGVLLAQSLFRVDGRIAAKPLTARPKSTRPVRAEVGSTEVLPGWVVFPSPDHETGAAARRAYRIDQALGSQATEHQELLLLLAEQVAIPDKISLVFPFARLVRHSTTFRLVWAGTDVPVDANKSKMEIVLEALIQGPKTTVDRINEEILDALRRALEALSSALGYPPVVMNQAEAA
jgi:hypothetical protein